MKTFRVQYTNSQKGTSIQHTHKVEAADYKEVLRILLEDPDYLEDTDLVKIVIAEELK